MWTRLNNEIVWPDVPEFRVTPRQSKAPDQPHEAPVVRQTTPEQVVTEVGEVLDQPEMARITRVLGGVAIETA